MLCQVTNIREVGEKNSRINEVLQKRVSILRPAKRKTKYLVKKSVQSILPTGNMEEDKTVSKIKISSGDMVKIRSEKEIRKMLDARDKYRGCLFIDEMFEYCGKSFKVLKEVHCFFDEAKQKMCDCKNMLLLEGVTCSGRQRLYSVSCDRSCFFFWHKDWLEKIEP